MNPRRVDLPKDFENRPFGVGEALSAGVSSARLRSGDLATPFRGTRVPAGLALSDPAAIARAYAPRLKPHQAFGGISAAALWGLPLPPAAEADRRAHVIFPAHRNRPTARRVAARSVSPAYWDVRLLDGVPVASPILTLRTLVPHLLEHDLAAVVDALRSTSELYESIAGKPRPLATSAQLDELAQSAMGMRGVGRLRMAIDFGRDEVCSPQESLLRWALMKGGGLPEPAINREVWVRGRKLGTPDLSYEWARLGIEYEGDSHRTDKSRWRGDITRVERFIAAGWRLMRVTVDDVFPDPWALIGRVTRHLAEHGMSTAGLPKLPEWA